MGRKTSSDLLQHNGFIPMIGDGRPKRRDEDAAPSYEIPVATGLDIVMALQKVDVSGGDPIRRRHVDKCMALWKNTLP